MNTLRWIVGAPLLIVTGIAVLALVAMVVAIVGGFAILLVSNFVHVWAEALIVGMLIVFVIGMYQELVR